MSYLVTLDAPLTWALLVTFAVAWGLILWLVCTAPYVGDTPYPADEVYDWKKNGDFEEDTNG